MDRYGTETTLESNPKKRAGIVCAAPAGVKRKSR